MKFHTKLPRPPGVKTFDDLILYWVLQGHTTEASRLSDIVIPLFKERPTNEYIEGRCNCSCGCQYVFREQDCQHPMQGTQVCDRCLTECHTLTIVFCST